MYIVNKSYIMRNADGQIFLINMKEGEVHLLNPVASLILEYIEECGDLEKGLMKTVEYFSDIDSSTIEKDFYELTIDMIEKRILVSV